MDAGLPRPSMAVNISAMEFRDERLSGRRVRDPRRNGPGSRSLELELTESVLMKHAESAGSILKELRAKGVQVGGRRFRHRLFQPELSEKISDRRAQDRPVLHPPDHRIARRALVITAVISMGRSLNLRVVAEGVETQDELAFLLARQCDEAQGYYFSRPVPPAQFAQLLAGSVVPAAARPGRRTNRATG